MANKITKREVINQMLAVEDISANAVFKAYLENELALLDKKAANKKATKNQEENVGIKEEILANLTEVGVTVSELQTKSEMLSALSNQRVSALLRQLIEDGKVVKTMDKKKAYFALPTEEVND